MPTTPFHTAFAGLPRESLFGGALERTAVRTDDALVTFNWIQPGHPEVPPHDHPYDQLSFVFNGTLEIELAGKPYPVHDGELLYIPAGVPHTGRVIGEEPVLNIDVFAPRREDYLHLASHQPEQRSRVDCTAPQQGRNPERQRPARDAKRDARCSFDKRASSPAGSSRLLGTSTRCAGPASSGTCSARAKQVSASSMSALEGSREAEASTPPRNGTLSFGAASTPDLGPGSSHPRRS